MPQILTFLLLFGFCWVIFNYVPRIPSIIKTRKASQLILNKEYEKGLELLAKSASSRYAKPFAKIRYAFIELKYGDLEKAKRQISLLLNGGCGPLKPKDKYEAKSVWGLIVLTEGDMEQAEEVAEELYEKYLNTDIYCTLGFIYNKVKTPKEAVKFNLEAYDYNSDKAVIADNLGQAYFLNGQIQEADELYSKTMGSNPAFPEFYYNYALVKKALGDKEAALELAKSALNEEFHNLTTISKEEVTALINELEGNDKDVG